MCGKWRFSNCGGRLMTANNTPAVNKININPPRIPVKYPEKKPRSKKIPVPKTTIKKKQINKIFLLNLIFILFYLVKKSEMILTTRSDDLPSSFQHCSDTNLPLFSLSEEGFFK